MHSKKSQSGLSENRTGRRIEILFAHGKSVSVTPLDFTTENVETLKENLQKYGWQVMSVWAMGDDLKTLQRSAEADVNLVVSAVGLRVAKILWEKYKIPYVIGTPNEWLAEDISNALERAATRQAEPAVVYLQNRMQQEADITLVGEPVTMGSLAAGIEKDMVVPPAYCVR